MARQAASCTEREGDSDVCARAEIRDEFFFFVSTSLWSFSSGMGEAISLVNVAKGAGSAIPYGQVRYEVFRRRLAGQSIAGDVA
jgi:hypothetical protein